MRGREGSGDYCPSASHRCWHLAGGYGFGFDSGAGAGLWLMRADDVLTNYPAAMETT